MFQWRYQLLYNQCQPVHNMPALVLPFREPLHTIYRSFTPSRPIIRYKNHKWFSSILHKMLWGNLRGGLVNTPSVPLSVSNQLNTQGPCWSCCSIHKNEANDLETIYKMAWNKLEETIYKINKNLTTCTTSADSTFTPIGAMFVCKY